MNSFSNQKLAIIGKSGNPAVHSFARAFKELFASHEAADSSPNVAVYEIGCAALPRMNAFAEQLSFLRTAEQAISTGAQIIVIPEVRCHHIADALRPALPVSVVDTATAVLHSIQASVNPIVRIRLISVTPPEDFRALVTRFADAGIDLSVVHLDQPESQLLVKLALQASDAGVQRLWLDDQVGHLTWCLPPNAPPVIDAIACGRLMLETLAGKPFKLGIVGGVGPAATVAFLDHIVQATPAQCDQEHMRIVIEQNPQIPDRTAHLLRNGTDPTLALLSTCERLQRAGAVAIAIPCNTAHAFVKRIENSLRVPVIHMLRESIDFIARILPDARTLGLLATDGTVDCGLYHDEARAAGFDLLIPSGPHQQNVMQAIYGPRGVKAGHRDATQRDAVERAIAHLASRGALAVILGCTELPLLVQQDLNYSVNGLSLPVVDPSRILAIRCVELSMQTRLASPRMTMAKDLC